MLLSPLVTVMGFISTLLGLFRCLRELRRSDVSETSLRVTNVVVSSNKGTQIGSSIGKVDLPYEQDDKILIPRYVGSKNVPSSSSVPSLPLQVHGGPSHRISDVRRFHVPDKNMRCVDGS